MKSHFLPDTLVPAAIVFLGYLLLIAAMSSLTFTHLLRATEFAGAVGLVSLASTWLMER